MGLATTSTSAPSAAACRPAWRVEGQKPAAGDQRNAMAALGLVQVRRGEHNRQALADELGQQLPEFAT
jgi:hypothetical protein